MLGRKQRDERYTRRRFQQIDRTAASAIESCLIGNQADAPASKRREAVALENVDAVRGGRGWGAGGCWGTVAPLGVSGEFGLGEYGGEIIEPATIEATRPRSELTSAGCFGSIRGCTRLLRNTTNVSLAGSIQIEVPVNPVWPKLPKGNRSPRLEE